MLCVYSCILLFVLTFFVLLLSASYALFLSALNLFAFLAGIHTCQVCHFFLFFNLSLSLSPPPPLPLCLSVSVSLSLSLSLSLSPPLSLNVYLMSLWNIYFALLFYWGDGGGGERDIHVSAYLLIVLSSSSVPTITGVRCRETFRACLFLSTI